MLNYFGQGALLLAHPEEVTNPFIILRRITHALAAGRAVDVGDGDCFASSDSGAFSVTRQAMQLGFLPRLEVQYNFCENGGAGLSARR